MTRATLAVLAVAAAASAAGLLAHAAAPADPHPVAFAGGHDVGPDDHGRPCALIAAALGVKTEVFREAFAGVTPARGRGPTGEEARANKAALMRVLAPHGVTHDRLDEVSDYYRYRPQGGGLWRHRAAAARAVVEGGRLMAVVVTDPGAGYSTPPAVAVKGFEAAGLVATLRFDTDLAKNGSVGSVEIKE